jgi:hypothetical protein
VLKHAVVSLNPRAALQSGLLAHEADPLKGQFHRVWIETWSIWSIHLGLLSRVENPYCVVARASNRRKGSNKIKILGAG